MRSLTEQYTKKRHRAQISLTPLIDVVFILLVFFMLASNFAKERSIELSTPSLQKSNGQASNQEIIKLEIQGNETFAVNGETVDMAGLSRLLNSAPGQPVLVKTADTATVQDVVAFMDLAALVHVTDIRLIASVAGK